MKSGKPSLYIEYYKGNSKTPDGKRKILRDFEYLELYSTTEPDTTINKMVSAANKNIWTIMVIIKRTGPNQPQPWTHYLMRS